MTLMYVLIFYKALFIANKYLIILVYQTSNNIFHLFV